MLHRFVGLNTKARPPICCAVAKSAADKRAHVRIYCFAVEDGASAAALSAAAGFRVSCLLALAQHNQALLSIMRV